VPRNPNKRQHRTPKEVNLQSLARSHTEMALRTLCGICASGKSESARVQAAQYILDRGWGRPPQSHTGEAGGGPIIVEIVYRTREPRVIEPPARVIDHVSRDEEKTAV
jgi:hypothetical protein